MPSAEVLAENRFLAARDGMDARLIDPAARYLIPVREILDSLLADCRPHALALGCAGALDRVPRLAAANGADRQRGFVARTGASTSWSQASLTGSSRPPACRGRARQTSTHHQTPTERSGTCAAGSHTPAPPSS